MHFIFFLLLPACYTIDSPAHGSKEAKLSEGEEERDVLDISVNLPEIDEPKPRLSSVVVVPSGSKELEVNSTAANERKSSGAQLFPHPPRKISTTDWAVRKPTHHGRHSSNIPRAQTHTSAQAKGANNNNNNNKRASLPNRLPNKSEGASSNQSVRAQVSVQRNTSRQALFDSNRRNPIVTPRRQLINRLANIPVQVDASTQTDPCKCQIRMRAKNRNRREAAKLNRDIVRSLEASQK